MKTLKPLLPQFAYDHIVALKSLLPEDYMDQNNQDFAFLLKAFDYNELDSAEDNAQRFIAKYFDNGVLNVEANLIIIDGKQTLHIVELNRIRDKDAKKEERRLKAGIYRKTV